MTIAWSQEKRFWQITALVFALIVGAPFFYKYTLIGHDLAFHLGRISGIAEGLSGENFPVKMYGYFMDGYGYPAGFFYPDLFLYLPMLLYRYGDLNIVMCYRIFGVMINVATVFVAQWTFVRVFSSWRLGSFIAIFYVGSLFRMDAFWGRVAVGEVLAMIFIPLALGGLWLTLRRSPKYWPSIVIGCTGVMCSHLLSTLMLMVVLIVLFLILLPSLKKADARRAILKAATFTFLLNIWFYVPFYSLYGKYNFWIKTLSDRFCDRTPFANFFTFHGYIGIASAIIVGLYLAVRIWRTVKDRHFNLEKHDKIFAVSLTVVTCAMLFWLDSFIWNTIDNVDLLRRITGKLQFSDRIMIFGSLAIATCTGAVIDYICSKLNNAKRAKIFVVGCLLFFAVLNLMTLFCPSFNMVMSERYHTFYEKTSIRSFLQTSIRSFLHILELPPDKIYDKLTVKDTMNFVDDSNSIIDPGVLFYDYIYADLNFGNKLHPIEYIENAHKILPPNKIEPREYITSYEKHGTKIKFAANLPDKTAVQVPLLYYYFYRATDEQGHELPLIENENHIMRVIVPEGTHEVTIQYVGQNSWRVAEFISLVALVAFIWLMLKEKTIQKNEGTT